MQTSNSQLKQQLPTRGLKQVKVDNWGTFFLQRLQQLYFDEELFDMTIKFPTSDITLQAHRLVITTCTDYFMKLEHQQKEKDENFNGVIVMPSDMPYECVKSIINFMYTGQLEYWTSEQTALYRTAQKMNMTVLTKLLDAQFNTSALQQTGSVATTKAKSPVQTMVVPMHKPAILAKKSPTTPSQPVSLPSQPLPGRKLPIWKRKLDTHPSMPISNYDSGSFHGSTASHRPTEGTPGPSRFDLPEVEDFALGVFSSFDDITYNTKPIVKAPDKYGSDKEPEKDGKNDSSEEEDEDDPVRGKETEVNSEDDWSTPKGILRPQEIQPSPSKRVRFDLEEKENLEKSKNTFLNDNPAESINNHARIIREVLKKYPHLVKNNKNIRLKIMQKEAKSSEPSIPAKTKVSYVVLKSDHLMSGNNSENEDSKVSRGPDISGETGPWKCNKCDLEEEYTNYYMYRRHMQDVHEEKFDPRVCEHCGYKATKRNILMYHLYTKHDVPPPKSMCFPKCHACSYVALSETLLVRHQINHHHRPNDARVHSSSSDELHCVQCSQTFRDTAELTSHEINTGHGAGGGDSRDKPHRCPHCGKTFVRLTNLHVHLDCAHKELRDNEPAPVAPISLEPSSEAEALSHVASGIAASLAVGDAIPTSDQQEISNAESTFIIPECIELADIPPGSSYNGQQEIDGQQMIMLIGNGTYPQQQEVRSQGENGRDSQETEELEVDDQPMEIVHEDAEESEEAEEIVEEVVEEVEEELMEDEIEQTTETLHDSNGDQVEEVIQYVEEETEIVEYDEEQSNQQDIHNSENPQDSQNSGIMISEDENMVEDIEEEEEVAEDDKEHRQRQQSRRRIYRKQGSVMIIEEEEEEEGEEEEEDEDRDGAVEGIVETEEIEEEVEEEEELEKLDNENSVENNRRKIQRKPETIADEWEEENVVLVES
ncbi:centrosome-associated zinc finger protein CP190 isoform X2 [Cephus cinctus]|uniref:Centrosome-associated zinc finger protein CP190 isoform X2 n=1 Tax=Cephus cinctus TaxID=211228 RepID=A0AAJ7FV93_CEPCN|nr:centrosome-associated zinc finger protein CP190 isoform X2 [Cephus cinctus]